MTTATEYPDISDDAADGGGDGLLETFRAFLLGDEPWRARARCRGADLALFFPKKGHSRKPAKALCQMCPVREECHDYAIRSNSTHGIWGGQMRHRYQKDENGNTIP